MQMVPRVGIGYDIHRFCEGRPLILGGVTIPHGRGLDGHSDADVLLHAVCDALLGAVGEGDIGEHFPNTDVQYKNISSVILLTHVAALVAARGYRIGNIDAVVVAEEPHIKKYKPAMCHAIAVALALADTQVNIKATTNETLGTLGRKEGIAAFATAVVVQR